MNPLRAAAAFVLAFLLTTVAAAQASGPRFPPLTGRVVDAANILPAQTEAQLTDRLAALERSTGRQLVVATAPSLQGYEIEEYGYRLGRAWGIGGERLDDGAILLVAPNERRVRVEVGYGLEGVLTDALSSRIIQESVLPRFRADDYPGGIAAGTDALIRHLSLPDEEARARVAAAQARPAQAGAGANIVEAILPLIFIIVLFAVLSGGARGRRRRHRGGVWIPPVIVWSGGSGWGGGGLGGGFGGGGGGFRGGGGSFGGGGASGSW